MAAWSEQMGNQNAKVECKTVGAAATKSMRLGEPCWAPSGTRVMGVWEVYVLIRGGK